MGNKIKEKREEMGMSQSELAQKSGVSRVTISGLENGLERNTTSQTLLRIAGALNTTIDQIFFPNSV